MSAVLKLGPTIAQGEALRLDTLGVRDFRGVVYFFASLNKQGWLQSNYV
jgi:hypothetical protein